MPPQRPPPPPRYQQSSLFQRPGQRQKSSFGISFDTDRDRDQDHILQPPLQPPSPSHHQHHQQTPSPSLPIYAHRTEILYLLETNQTVIIIGETGCGKSTQIPQYLVQAGWTRNNKAIAITQPRRIATISIASRVAEEMGGEVGGQVGYAIPFEDVSSPEQTKIKYITDQVLIREMMEDPLLTKYSVVMVDEAHERSLYTDVVLGLLKKVQRKRHDLRVIVASATIDAEHIARFFNETKAILTVSGRPHSVQVHYLTKPSADYVRTAVEAAVNIHKDDLPGDVLIFLTFAQECERAAEWIREEEQRLSSGSRHQQYTSDTARKNDKRKRMVPFTLYSGLSSAQQMAVFDPAARNTRRVICATQVAETSLTIQGIVYVIDCMYARQRCFDPIQNLESHLIAPISRSSAIQRSGRAGRLRPGHCFRLCTESDYKTLLQNTDVPEMQRASLASVVLQLKALGIDSMMTFHWLAPPPAEAMVRALETLHALGALDNDARLTHPLGVHMSELPFQDPQLARMVLAGSEVGCGEEVATVAAMLSVQSVWAHAGERALSEAKARFAVAQGDVLTYLNVWQAWSEVGGGGNEGRRKKWAYDNYISYRAMVRVEDVRKQVLMHLRRLGVGGGMRGAALVPGVGVQQRQAIIQQILKCVVKGFFINTAMLVDEGGGRYQLVGRSAQNAAKLRIHQSSVLHRCLPQWVCFVSARQTDSGWYEMQELTVLEDGPGWLTEVAGHYYYHTSS